MITTQKERFYMATIITSLVGIVAVTLLSGCSGAEDPGPVMHYELDGTWCDTKSEQTCLTVKQLEAGARYMLQVGLCFERGRLTGGLEFIPDTDSRVCLPGFSYGLWSASASFTPVGLKVADLNQSDGISDGTVTAPDLDLYYTGH